MKTSRSKIMKWKTLADKKKNMSVLLFHHVQKWPGIVYIFNNGKDLACFDNHHYHEKNIKIFRWLRNTCSN